MILVASSSNASDTDVTKSHKAKPPAASLRSRKQVTAPAPPVPTDDEVLE
jgi:hypothetical protein